LGELVSTINLAPGEDRTVVLTKTFERESSVTRSATSIFDISRSDTSDLATEMENQARQESENSSNMSLSATAKGSYGLFSAEASASSGTSTSLKSFGQAISKVARKASQAINQQNREEVSTSSSVKTSVSNTDETSATIQNINQGRTLNLLFYRLNNKFRGGIYLDDLQFEVIPSSEIIGGSGVYESLRFTLSEIPQLLEQFQQSRLPFDIVPDDSSKSDFLTQVVDSLKSLLEREYMSGSEPAATAGAKGARSMPLMEQDNLTSVGRMSLGPESAHMPLKESRSFEIDGLQGDAGTDLSDFVARLKYATIDSNTPVLSDDLILASGGLYLDSVVGAQASTEPYSEEMRAQEIRMRDAEVQKALAEAEYQRALAASLGQAELSGTGSNAIVEMVADTARKSLRVQARWPVAAGNWDLFLDAECKSTCKLEESGVNELLFRWRAAQRWLDEKDLKRRIAVEEKTTRHRLEFTG